MVNALGPVWGLRDGFRRIYGSHLKDEDRGSKINRIWTTFFGLSALALGIAFAVSCSSSPTSSTHLVVVNTTQLIWDVTNNATNALVNDTSSTAKGNLLNIYQQNEARLPAQYLFGFSGCCRVYPNASKTCIKSFPQNPDILTTVITDINTIATSNSTAINPVSLVSPSFSSMQKSYITTSKVYAALITTIIGLTFLTTILVLIFPSKSAHHLFLTLPGALIAVGSAVVFTWCIVLQITTYELDSAYAAISFGPGSFILWAWMVCIMLLTPLTAMISILVAVAVVLLILWIGFLCLMCVLACLACAGGSGNQNQQDVYNPCAMDPNNPSSPNYNPDN